MIIVSGTHRNLVAFFVFGICGFFGILVDFFDGWKVFFGGPKCFTDLELFVVIGMFIGCGMYALVSGLCYALDMGMRN